ncbi:WD40 repeat domain-containing protein [Streptomyces echinatus]|uniref:WD40 repeat domain-containing protein n=1 Tax=Streptomyces echinatus TaxID=67293 RepID=UPI00378DD7B6
MLRADSPLGRLVLALAAYPPQEPAVPPGRPGARLVAALGARPVPVAAIPVRMPPAPRTSAYRPSAHRPSAHLSLARGRWLSGLLTTWLIVLTCLTAAAVQEVLPTPWEQVEPQRAGGLPPEQWRLVDGGRLGPAGRADALAFTPDGRSLVTISRSSARTWEVWDPEDPEHIALPHGMRHVTAVGTSPDGRTLVAAGAEGVRGLSLDSGTTRWSAGGIAGEVKALAVTGREVLLADAARDGTTGITALGAGTREARRLSRLGLTARSARFSPDGRTLAVAEAGGPVRLWDVSDPRHPRAGGPLPASSGHETTALAFSPDARMLATVDSGRTVRLWDLTERAHPRSLGRPLGDGTERVAELAFSPDGRLVATVGADGTATLWWRSPGTEAHAPDVPSGATAQ